MASGEIIFRQLTFQLLAPVTNDCQQRSDMNEDGKLKFLGMWLDAELKGSNL